ncbi:glycosyltransferase [Bizionia sp. KMM 8389]
MKSNLKIRIKNTFLAKKLKRENKLLALDSIDTSKPVVLVIDHMIPEFDKDSGSRRLFELIKLMLKNKYTVVLMADLKEYKYQSNYIAPFQELGVYVYEPGITKNGAFLSKAGFIKAIASKIDFVWLHRPEIFKGYYSFIKKQVPEARFIFDMVDFHYLRLFREYEIDGNEKTLQLAKNFLKIELDNCHKADKIVLISTGDETALQDFDIDLNKAEILSNVHQHQPKSAAFVPFEARKELLFIGGFKHAPNEDAVLYLHTDIMPKIWAVYPDLVVHIIGSYPTESVQALHSDLFKIHGFVTDVAPYFNTAKAFVAPLRYGAGIKGKIGQSLEYSLPVVTTGIGAEGFDFSPYADTMIANDADAFAANVLEIIGDKNLFNAVSDASETILAPFSLAQTETNLLKVLA